MNYSSSLSFLYALTNQGIKFGLSNTKQFLKVVNGAEPSAKIIHIAGSNGKGSCAIMIHDILMNHGLKVGLFTSPHIRDYTERFRVNGKLISHDYVNHFVNKYQSYIRRRGLTFFEVCTVLAIDYFKHENCDYIVLETGMGGRLDSTNCFLPIATIITNISLEHQNYLGESINQIIVEKAGIIKANIPIFCADESKDKQKKIQKIAKKIAAPYINLTRTFNPNYALSLLGLHQKRNAHTAFFVTKFILKNSFKTTYAKNALKNVKWNGRLEIWDKNKRVILDVSHNTDGIQKTVDCLKEIFPNEKFSIVFAFLDDKKSEECINALGKLSSILYVFPLKNNRFNLDKFVKYPRFPFKQEINSFLKKTNCSRLLVIGSHYLLDSFLSIYDA